MQKEKATSMTMNFKTEEEILETIIDENHVFRKLNKLVNWNQITKPLRKLYPGGGAIGTDVTKGVKALIIQFWEDYSDRQMEKAMKENSAVKWFCGYRLTEQTPDHSYFGKLRKRIGTKKISDLFRRVNEIMEGYGLVGNVFEVIDASAIITKTQLWEERDRAISDGHEKLNNKVVDKYANDTQARWGAKGKNKVWFGYKRHASIDTRYGIIKKVAVTPANVLDHQAAKHVVGRDVGVYTDKGYDYKEATEAIEKKGSTHLCIRMNNKKEKNHRQDKYRTKIRMPYESTFSQLRKRARYVGQAKVMLQVFLESICFNLKKAITYESVYLHV
jgi:IS5 family transposase